MDSLTEALTYLAREKELNQVGLRIAMEYVPNDKRSECQEKIWKAMDKITKTYKKYM